jgi:hypothetical protein
MDLSATCLAAAGIAPSPDYSLDRQNLLSIGGERTGHGAHAVLADRGTAISGPRAEVIGSTRRSKSASSCSISPTIARAWQSPALFTELPSLHDEWQRQMPIVPENLVPPMISLSDMLW